MKNWIREYKASLKTVEIEETLDLLIYRPMGFFLVKAVQRTSVTPNQLTLTALLFGVLAGLSFAAGPGVAFVAGGIFYFLFNVLDCSDGQLARIKHNGTPAGRIIDGVADYIAGLAVLFGLGIGFTSGFQNPWLWWLLLLAGGVSNILHSIVTDNERNRFLRHAFGKNDEFGDTLGEYEIELIRLQNHDKGAWFSISILKIYLGYMKLAGNLNRQPSVRTQDYDPQVYYHANKSLIKAWTFLGPTTHITIVVVATLLQRPDWAAWFMLIPLNIYWLVLYILQQRTLKKLLLSHASLSHRSAKF